MPGEVLEYVCQRSRRRVEVDEDESLPGLAPNRDERVLCRLEVDQVLGVLRPLQLALEVVRPRVIRALDPDDLPARLLEDRRTPVAADVVERTEPTVAATDDHDVLAGDGSKEIIAAVRGFLGSADADPVLREPVLLLEGEDRGIVEDAGRQEPSGLEGASDGVEIGIRDEVRGDPRRRGGRDRKRRSHGRIVTRPDSNALGVPSRGPGVPRAATSQPEVSRAPARAQASVTT